MDSINELWPDWELKELIGQGSSGSVYRIEKKVRGKIESSALKIVRIPQNDSEIQVLYAQGLSKAEICQRMSARMSEAVSAYSLMAQMKGSKNLVSCDELRTLPHDDGIGWDIYVRMDLLTPLLKTLGKSRSEDEIVRLAADICSALSVCSSRGIVNGGISPENIFISDEGSYKLGNFGLSKNSGADSAYKSTYADEFASPEAYNDQPCSSASDIYSLGLVLYWLLNDYHLPFYPDSQIEQKTFSELQARIKRLSGEKLPEPRHGSEKLRKIVMKACEFKPSDRYQNPGDMLTDINSAGLYSAVGSRAASAHSFNGSTAVNRGPAVGSSGNSSPEDFDDEGTVVVFSPGSKAGSSDSKFGGSGSGETGLKSAGSGSKGRGKIIAIAASAVLVLALICVGVWLAGSGSGSGTAQISGSEAYSSAHQEPSSMSDVGWQENGGAYYYLDAKGKPYTGWQNIDGSIYYFDESGCMCKGWEMIDGSYYIFSESGVMQTGWIEYEGQHYYFGADGAMTVGWADIDGYFYYFDSQGVMCSGWIEVDGNSYYLDESGVMQTGWLVQNNCTYYLDGSGIMQTGWIEVENFDYYFTEKGHMVTGWQKIDDILYYFDNYGHYLY